MATVRLVRSQLRQELLRHHARMREEVNQEMRDIGEELKAWHDLVVRDWTNRPGFEIFYVIGPYRIVVGVRPTGRNAMIWQYVNEGTDPHLIFPRAPGGKLKFRTAYTARTAAVAKVNPAGGRSSGPWVTKDFVNHPGSEARQFTETFEDNLRKDFRRRAENAIRRGIRRS